VITISDPLIDVLEPWMVCDTVVVVCFLLETGAFPKKKNKTLLHF
jgi:hypothetical protein